MRALLLCALGLPWCVAEAGGAEPPTDAPTPQPKAGKLELNVFPIVGGDSDVGIGGGQVSNLARLGATPGSFLWKIEDATFVTFKLRDGGLIGGRLLRRGAHLLT